MSNRHLARTVAMQILFEWDFNNRSEKLSDVMNYNIREFGAGLDTDREFIDKLVHGVAKNMTTIDELITKYAPEWPIEKITIIDRSVLRLGIYELIIEKEVPPKVAINASIEVVKTYGGESSSRFIKGVFAPVSRDIQNPHHSLALALRTDDPVTIIGYCPRYLTDDFNHILDKCTEICPVVTVAQVNVEAPYQLRLLCKLISIWPESFQPCSTELYQEFA